MPREKTGIQQLPKVPSAFKMQHVRQSVMSVVCVLNGNISSFIKCETTKGNNKEAKENISEYKYIKNINL